MGGGVQGGQVVGATDEKGVDVQERPIPAVDLLATIYTLLAIDPDALIMDPEGRPVPIVDNRTASPRLIDEILS